MCLDASVELPMTPTDRWRVERTAGSATVVGMTWRVAGRTLAVYEENQAAPVAKLRFGGIAMLRPEPQKRDDVMVWRSANNDLILALYNDGGCLIVSAHPCQVLVAPPVLPRRYADDVTTLRMSDTCMVGVVRGANNVTDEPLGTLQPGEPLIVYAASRRITPPVMDVCCAVGCCIPGAATPLGALPPDADGSAIAEAFPHVMWMHHKSFVNEYKPPWVPCDLEAAKHMAEVLTENGATLYPYSSAHYHRAFPGPQPQAYIDEVDDLIERFGLNARLGVYIDGWPARDSGQKPDPLYAWTNARMLAALGIPFILHGTMVGAPPFTPADAWARLRISGEGQRWTVEQALELARTPMCAWAWQCIGDAHHAPGLDGLECLKAAVRAGGSVMTFPYQIVQPDGTVRWQNGMTSWYVAAVAERSAVQTVGA